MTNDNLVVRPQRAHGMRDLLPADTARLRLAEHAFLEAAARWGYQEIRTPTVERLSLFTAAGTLSPEMLGRVYSFLDWDGWSGERVVLRPDSTIPAVRLLIEGELTLPARLCYVQSILRFESGDRAREEWQCGLEALGSESEQADAEVLIVAAETLRALGIEPSVRLSHTGIIRPLLAAGGLGREESLELYDAVLAEGLGALRRLPDESGLIATVLNLIERVDSTGFLSGVRPVLSAHLPEAAEPLDRLEALVQTLSDQGIACLPDLTLLRDFEYYTGPVFELHARAAVVGGGGRYDGVYRLLAGTDAPATGIALFLEPICRLLDHEEPEQGAIPVREGSLNLRLQLHARGLQSRIARQGEAALGESPDGPRVFLPDGAEKPARDIDEAVALLRGRR